MNTVLIVEDDPVNVRVFMKILKKRGGLNAKHSEDVEEIIRMAETGEADIILMDVSLARSVYKGKSVNGIQITQILKANPKTQNVPILLVTANAMAGDKEAFLEQSGADGYISKPVVDHQEFVQEFKNRLPAE